MNLFDYYKGVRRKTNGVEQKKLSEDTCCKYDCNFFVKLLSSPVAKETSKVFHYKPTPLPMELLLRSFCAILKQKRCKVQCQYMYYYSRICYILFNII